MTPVGIALGLTLGLGVLLVLSVWLWPRGSKAESSAKVTRLSAVATQLSVSVPVFATVSILAAGSAGIIGWAFSGVIGLALAVAVLGGVSPWLIALSKRNASAKALRGQWPDAVDALLSSLRSGKTVPDAIAALANSHSRHIAYGAACFERDFRLTANFGGSLTLLKNSWADPAADRIVETLRLMRESGSSDGVVVLQTLGGQLRADSALRQEVDARQGWVRIAARIGVFAPWVVLAVLSTRAEAVTAYNSPAGVTLICLGLVISIVAYRLMIKLGHFPHQRRWLA